MPLFSTIAVSTPYDVALNQLISQIDEPLFKENAILFILALRDEFHNYLESRGVHNVTSYRCQPKTTANI